MDWWCVQGNVSEILQVCQAMKEFHEVDSGVALCCMTKCDTVDAGKQGAQVRGYTAKHWTKVVLGCNRSTQVGMQ